MNRDDHTLSPAGRTARLRACAPDGPCSARGSSVYPPAGETNMILGAFVTRPATPVSKATI